MAEVGLRGEEEFQSNVRGLGRIVDEFLGIIEGGELGAAFAVLVHCYSMSTSRPWMVRGRVSNTVMISDIVYLAR